LLVKINRFDKSEAVVSGINNETTNLSKSFNMVFQNKKIVLPFIAYTLTFMLFRGVATMASYNIIEPNAMKNPINAIAVNNVIGFSQQLIPLPGKMRFSEYVNNSIAEIILGDASLAPQVTYIKRLFSYYLLIPVSSIPFMYTIKKNK